MASSVYPHNASKHSLSPKLKALPPRLSAQISSCRSDEIHASPGGAPPNSDIRRFYLSHIRGDEEAFVPPPLISASPFVPPSLIRLLMRGKKDTAIGVKYASGDKITNMEGALHTFVTPVIGRCEMIGDYKYEYGHGIERFGNAIYYKNQKPVLVTRSVALSASIQPDFETQRVMLVVAKLDSREVFGKDLFKGRKENELLWEPYSAQEKQDEERRQAYDDRLRAHMVFHLTASHYLPSYKDIANPMSTEKAIAFLEKIILSKYNVDDQLVKMLMVTHNNLIVSVEVLYNTALHQVINEFSALEAMFPQGYVYTYDPAVIFAREIGSPILNRLFLTAVKAVSSHNRFTNMRAFAINDFADKKLVGLLDAALAAQFIDGKSLSGRRVQCCAKSELFKGKGGLYKGENKGAMLVIHNNSDAFGQNIETEGSGGSLDGAIGASSSAAASLERGRKDLLDFIF